MPHCIPCKAREATVFDCVFLTCFHAHWLCTKRLQVGTCYFAGIFGDLGNCDPQKGLAWGLLLFIPIIFLEFNEEVSGHLFLL